MKSMHYQSHREPAPANRERCRGEGKKDCDDFVVNVSVAIPFFFLSQLLSDAADHAEERRKEEKAPKARECN